MIGDPGLLRSLPAAMLLAPLAEPPKKAMALGGPYPWKRKAAWDRVQQIVYDRQPFIYLVNKDAQPAMSPELANAQPVVLPPQTCWNIDELYLRHASDRSGQ